MPRPGESEYTVDNSSFQALQEKVRGQVITSDQADYDTARAVFNGMIDKRPAAILRVSQVGRRHRSRELRAETPAWTWRCAAAATARPGSGPATAASSSTSPTAGACASIPPMRRRGPRPGRPGRDFNHATHAFGLATTGGIIGSTGIAGLTLGGGIGYLARKYGLSCDNLLSADVVTADGKFLTASDDANEDLFWALRGGGGNFGVVTSFEYRLHPVDISTAADHLPRSTTPTRWHGSTASTSPRPRRNWADSSASTRARRCRSCPRSGTSSPSCVRRGRAGPGPHDEGG